LAKTVYLHLGLHKTATGWLQRQFFPRLELPLHRTRKLEKIAALAAGLSADRIIVSHEGLGGRIGDDKAPGDSLKMFEATLEGISGLRAEPKLLIGFREHAAWLGSAYAQRGKKSSVTPEAYRDSYSREDLLWMRRVALCDERGLGSFLFLYEEFAHDPLRLCEDLCRFLGVALPDDTAALLARRENPSPRTEKGLRMSRAAYALARVLGALPFVDAKRLRQAASEFGASFDSDEAPIRIGFRQEDAAALGSDWEELVSTIGERRGRDFSAFSPHGRDIKAKP
jgi:hypothetical protein